MNKDDESPWLRDRMQQLRERRNGSVIAFERVWGAARAQQTSLETKSDWPAWRFATATVAGILLAAAIVFHIAGDRKQRREKEQEFAAVDGVLMTYWQAPSDDLLPVSNATELPKRDE